MKLVIDITDEMWQAVQDGWVGNELWHSALENGTPLPKGHGRIIDYGYVVDAIDDWINAGEYNYTNATEYLRKRIANTPTIVEAEGTKE